MKTSARLPLVILLTLTACSSPSRTPHESVEGPKPGPVAGAPNRENPGASGPAPDADPVAERYRLAAEQRLIQAERLYREGRAFHLAGDEARALKVLDTAVRLDPSHEAARDLRARLASSLHGSGPMTDELTARETARRRAALERRRADVKRLIAAGDRAADAGDPTTAVRHYRDALLILDTAPGAGRRADVTRRLDRHTNTPR